MDFKLISEFQSGSVCGGISVQWGDVGVAV